MTLEEEIYWNGEFTDAELDSMANVGAAQLPIGDLSETLAQWEKDAAIDNANHEWYENNRDTQW